jgi:arsenite methyltransferase
MAPRFIARQLAFPKGIIGRVMGLLMNVHNARINEFAIQKMTVRPPEKILEIGFGGGLTLARLIASSGHLSGVDRSEEMVRQANSKFSKAVEDGRADFRTGNVEALPFAAETFSKVLTVNTIYFWKSLEVCCGEIRRVLAPGGQAVIGFMPKEHMMRKKMPADIFSLRTIDDVTSALRNAGFSETRIERPESAPKWAVVLAKK